MSDIELNIDELVLNGFPAEQQDEIRNSFRSELTRLLSEQGISAKGSAAFQTDSNTPARVEGGSAQNVGIQAAQSIYGRMSR